MIKSSSVLASLLIRKADSLLSGIGSALSSRRSQDLSKANMTTLPPVPNEANLVWIDMEMTGLDLKKDKIIEVACIVTGPNLDDAVEGPHEIINCPNEILEGMDEWCLSHHGASGLIEEVKRSKRTVEEVEQQLIDFVSKYCPPGKCPLAGSSVHCDRAFLVEHMPRFTKFLHYRIVDVSSIKEMAKRWYPDMYKTLPPKGEAHRAMADIRDSIKELKWYRENVFVKH